MYDYQFDYWANFFVSFKERKQEEKKERKVKKKEERLKRKEQEREEREVCTPVIFLSFWIWQLEGWGGRGKFFNPLLV